MDWARLRLAEDVLSSEAAPVALPALPRVIFVVHGSLTVADRPLGEEEVWSGDGAITLKSGREGATLWRWELAAGSFHAAPTAQGVASREKLCARLETLPEGALLLRADSVAFPPGGCAYLHRHQGPGIRCVLEGGIRIDTLGRSTSYGPGGAWYENGPEPVFAQAAGKPTRFLRVMVLPAAIAGRSSIEYLNEEDKSKPRTQKYKSYAELPITLAQQPQTKDRGE
jgi:hypothetical protein